MLVRRQLSTLGNGFEHTRLHGTLTPEMDDNTVIERHPLSPFIPDNARLLLLGSFPPQRKRWSMEFFYPNFNNDMWRIFGVVFFGDKHHFIDSSSKSFDKRRIIEFLERKGIALYDTATRVRRLKNNASDNDLEIIEETNIKELLDRATSCTAVCTTGQKATEILCKQFDIKPPKTGQSVDIAYKDRTIRLFRMPSSSRAYPASVEQKASLYKEMFSAIFSS